MRRIYLKINNLQLSEESKLCVEEKDKHNSLSYKTSYADDTACLAAANSTSLANT